MPFKIKYDKEKCIGCKACTNVSKNWVDAGAKVKPVKTTVNEIGDNQAAADGCPVGAITIEKA